MVPVIHGECQCAPQYSLPEILQQVDEEEGGGLRALAEVLMSYGERHFDGSPSQRRQGMWANVLIMCGQFERVRQPTMS